MDKKVSADLLKQIESGYSLPSLSPVSMRLVEIASDDTCSAEELAAVIERDPSLAVRVLTLANSAFFQTRQSTTSLRQAVVKLGFQRLRIMALSLSLRDTFLMGKIGPLDYEEFWHTTLYRALIAKSFAAHLKNCYPEKAFVAGLIMEIGLLILFDLRIKWDTEVPPIRLEPLEERGDIVEHTLQAVAHEIRNPLLAVGGFARKLAASFDPASRGGKYVKIILEEASRLEKALSEMTRKDGHSK
jgi:HD-like signal output (HDOD) protein